MVAFGACVLTAVVSLLPPSLQASTYDQAACDTMGLDAHALDAAAHPLDTGDLVALADQEDERDCRVPAPEPAPAVIDCNDARTSVWVRDMIGSCDMPRPAPPVGGVLPVVRNPTAAGPARICYGSCTRDAYPLRPAPRVNDDSWPLITQKAADQPQLVARALAPQSLLAPSQTDRDSLERPPRA